MSGAGWHGWLVGLSHGGLQVICLGRIYSGALQLCTVQAVSNCPSLRLMVSQCTSGCTPEPSFQRWDAQPCSWVDGITLLSTHQTWGRWDDGTTFTWLGCWQRNALGLKTGLSC